RKRAEEAAEEARKAAEATQRRRRRNVAIAVTAAVGGVGTFLYWQFYTLPQTSRSWIRQIKETTLSETQMNKLWWLDAAQPWTSPYDLSGTPKLANISFPDLRLYAPNFSGVKFSRVSLQKARLPSASFSQSQIYIEAESEARKADGSGFKWNDIRSWFRGTPPDWTKVKWNEFSGAGLRLTEFREAEIITTSFAGADLYRAVFDRALLCDVNFSNADLRKASFWGATIDDRTYGWLRKTAWWVAVGWNSHDFKKLLRPQNEDQLDPRSPSVYPATNPADARALRQALRESERFHADIEIPITETRPGTFDRAVALNDMAWTLTTWGIDKEDVTPTPAPCDSNSHPKDALDAARQAICIIEDLKKNGSRDKDYNYDYWLANFRDTQAYILMQADKMSEARALYEKDIARTEADPGMLFRYAIALYGSKDPNAAQSKFETAISEKQYLPSTELQNLKQYIPRKILNMAYEAIDAAYPTPKPNQVCPATNPN
ncbi:MAG: pentapeptide repeat-containing protein, partial [Bradyrhizobium sp.]